MQDELKNILTDAQGNISEEELLRYLRQQLGKNDERHVEQRLVDEDFDSEAVDGLQQLENKEKIEMIVDGLNRDLRKRTQKKIYRKSIRRVKPEWWLYFSVLILLILVVIIFLFFHKTS